MVKFGPGKLFCVCCVCIRDQCFNNFENNTLKLVANEAKLTSLWARNCATIQRVWILPGLSRNGPQDQFVGG